jgi:hypothetical protein
LPPVVLKGRQLNLEIRCRRMIANGGLLQGTSALNSVIGWKDPFRSCFRHISLGRINEGCGYIDGRILDGV